MKTYKYAIALVCAICLILSSCGEDFLYKAPKGSVSKETLATESGADMIVTAAYGYLTATGWGRTPFNWVFGGIYGGDANKGTDSGDQPPINQFEQYIVASNNDYISEKYSWTYRGGQRVRVALQHMDDVSGLDSRFVSVRKGELYFLRAMYYFEGLKVFGPFLPYVDETNFEENPKVYNDKDIYPDVLADAQKAIDLLEDKPYPTSDLGRTYKWAAKALKAKILMQQPGMPGRAEAKSLLEDVLNNGSTASGIKFALTESLDFNWNCDNDNKSSESIYEIQFTSDVNNNANAGMSLCYPYDKGPGGCCGFYQPSYELANSFQVDENGLPFLDNSYRSRQSISWFEMVEVDDVDKDGNPIKIKVFTLFNNENQLVDPRIDFTMGRDQIPYKDWGVCHALSWVRDFENGGIFNPKKHVYHNKHAGTLGRPSLHDGWAPGSSMNIQYLSVRDAMLMLAELYADEGNLKGAMDLVNKVRQRAGNGANVVKYSAKDLADPNLYAALKAKVKEGDPAAKYLVKEYPSSHAAFSDKATCVAAVRMERKLELAMEGHRWFDLVRYGGDVMNREIAAYLEYEKTRIGKFASAVAIPNDYTTLPLPIAQIQTMGKDDNDKDYLEQHGVWVGK